MFSIKKMKFCQANRLLITANYRSGCIFAFEGKNINSRLLMPVGVAYNFLKVIYILTFLG